MTIDRGCIRGVLCLFSLLLAVPHASARPQPADDVAGALAWRLVGPFRGGWATVGAGIADEPDTFYFGTAGGGVWKTVDAGRTFTPILDGQPAAAVGALAVAPSNPRVLYVGTGQPDTRYDVAAGNGVYRSGDGGASWRRVGLEGTRHIGDILVDPRDPDVVLVAALGHLFGPSPERGVFRSTDGGKSWRRTLAIDDATGVVDLASDPADARVVFAAAWQARVHPWLSYFTPLVGPGSAIYRSSDGGITWKRLGGHGLPDGELGRIGLAVAHVAGGTRVYALINARDKDKGGLYRSDDGGANWRLMSADGSLLGDYFSRLTVAPADPSTLFVMGRSIQRSRDGGKSFAIIKGAPGGDDYHDLWINPKHPERMITASDQGAVITVDGGATWSSWYNQPTGQFYRLGADHRFPYWIYSGQQDSGSVAIASRSDYGAITFRDWHPVGAEERDGNLPDPGDDNIVYGAGLGGTVTRWDARNGEVQNISPWPLSSYGRRPSQFKYHYTWITPLAVSERAPYALYAGAQVLFRSTDHGATWRVISPDLSSRASHPSHCDDESPTNDVARDCGYGVIYDIGLSARDPQEIWIGTDDGRIHRTDDGGKRWQDVTPHALPSWAKVSTIEPSPLAAGVAYAAVDNHRQDDFAPHVFRTRDQGRTWSEVDAGLPRDSFVTVVRADPKRAGLLYAGTERGVFVSQDDGDSWRPLQRNLPTATVTALLVHGDDLVAATQGRAIWVLDDVTPLREPSASFAAEAAHLFSPAVAIRVRANQNRDTPMPREEPAGRNPPTGAMIDYWLATDAATPVAIEIRDARGNLVRRFASDDKAGQPRAHRYFEERWATAAPAPLSTTAGVHRFVWDLRLPRPPAAHYEYGMGAVDGEPFPPLPQGMLAPPGRYVVTLAALGRTYRAPLEIRPDPRLPLEPRALGAALALSRTLTGDLERDRVLFGQLCAVQTQLTKLAADRGADAALLTLVRAVEARMEPLLAGKGESAPNVAAVGDALGQLEIELESTDRAPTAAARQLLGECEARLARAAAEWSAMEEGELARLDIAVRAAGRPPIDVPAANRTAIEPSGDSEDLP
ncbi:MAG: hypothetical protein JWM53_3399 [bacterium]|nr:hypothetical protein [bacterium]